MEKKIRLEIWPGGKQQNEGPLGSCLHTQLYVVGVGSWQERADVRAGGGPLGSCLHTQLYVVGVGSWQGRADARAGRGPLGSCLHTQLYVVGAGSWLERADVNAGGEQTELARKGRRHNR